MDIIKLLNNSKDEYIKNIKSIKEIKQKIIINNNYINCNIENISIFNNIFNNNKINITDILKIKKCDIIN
tara:strand:+ start:661 stop:870 length:210 start_codon:yes stop_codon:yes gene_type:complete